MRIEELKDKPVLSIASGTKLGAVHDFLLDDSYLQIAALVIGGGGLFGGHKQAVAYSSIHGIGPDAVMVRGLSTVQEVGDSGPLGKVHALDTMEQQVMSESGVDLGRVIEMEFEPQTGAMTSLCFTVHGDTASEGSGVCGINRDDIVSMTEKMVIVRQSIVELTEDAPNPAQPPDRGQVMGRVMEPASTIEDEVTNSSEAGFEPAPAEVRA
jgi:uncharacterized protein YrrD